MAMQWFGLHTLAKWKRSALYREFPTKRLHIEVIHVGALRKEADLEVRQATA